jgi:rubrerythrin
MSYPNQTIQQGWECPKCRRIYSPTTPMCSNCPQEVTPWASTNDLVNRAYTTTSIGVHNFVASQENPFKCAICGAYETSHPIFTFKN